MEDLKNYSINKLDPNNYGYNDRRKFYNKLKKDISKKIKGKFEIIYSPGLLDSIIIVKEKSISFYIIPDIPEEFSFSKYTLKFELFFKEVDSDLLKLARKFEKRTWVYYNTVAAIDSSNILKSKLSNLDFNKIKPKIQITEEMVENIFRGNLTTINFFKKYFNIDNYNFIIFDILKQYYKGIKPPPHHLLSDNLIGLAHCTELGSLLFMLKTVDKSIFLSEVSVYTSILGIYFSPVLRNKNVGRFFTDACLIFSPEILNDYPFYFNRKMDDSYGKISETTIFKGENEELNSFLENYDGSDIPEFVIIADKIKICKYLLHIEFRAKCTLELFLNIKYLPKKFKSLARLSPLCQKSV